MKRFPNCIRLLVLFFHSLFLLFYFDDLQSQLFTVLWSEFRLIQIISDTYNQLIWFLNRQYIENTCVAYVWFFFFEILSGVKNINWLFAITWKNYIFISHDNKCLTSIFELTHFFRLILEQNIEKYWKLRIRNEPFHFWETFSDDFRSFSFWKFEESLAFKQLQCVWGMSFNVWIKFDLNIAYF